MSLVNSNLYNIVCSPSLDAYLHNELMCLRTSGDFCACQSYPLGTDDCADDVHTFVYDLVSTTNNEETLIERKYFRVTKRF